jgi:signal transduction histidine kinase
MGQIIDDLLRLSRIIRSDLRMGPVDLSLLVQGISDTCRNASPDRNVEMIIAPHVRVMADTNLLQIALENLIGNAWKFTRKAADPRIEFGVCDQADSQRSGEITCFIKDNGVGFDMAMADRLFTPFQRLHPQSEFSGTGIGLAIVHRIIAKHGGRIWAEAEVGGGAGAGAVFYFTLKNAEC